MYRYTTDIIDGEREFFDIYIGSNLTYMLLGHKNPGVTFQKTVLRVEQNEINVSLWL